MRKIIFSWMALAIMLIGALSLQSCSDDDDDNWRNNLPSALVTVKNYGDLCYLQIDDKTSVIAKNLSKPFGGKQVRALVNYTPLKEQGPADEPMVHVNWIDSILTKKPVPTLANEEENKAKYGDDQVDIVRDWVTVAEDGYLTLRFRAFWGGVKAHSINLLYGVNPENPYEVELRHNTNGDPQMQWGDALVAFDLNDVLPDTQGKTVKLTIRWKSTNGDKKVEFDYCSRKSITSPTMLNGFDKPMAIEMK